MAGFISRIQPKLGQMFSHPPRAPYGIERFAPALEGAQTLGIYDEPSATEPRGVCHFNRSDLKNRTLLNAGIQELIPGHHLQMNLQRENDALPEFRRYGSYRAYTEGWAFYAAALAYELGMYGDPYDYYGYLAMNQFYSVRLVVDTGMNYLGWSRSQAAEYMCGITCLNPMLRSALKRCATRWTIPVSHWLTAWARKRLWGCVRR
jgi:uncharacterized protein (DUF885 family)